jgi:hypothetical protein
MFCNAQGQHFISGIILAALGVLFLAWPIIMSWIFRSANNDRDDPRDLIRYSKIESGQRAHVPKVLSIENAVRL